MNKFISSKNQLTTNNNCQVVTLIILNVKFRRTNND